MIFLKKASFLPKAYRRLLPLRRLILYIYTKGLLETPLTQKVYSIYLYQRLTGDSSHSEGLFYIFIPKAYRRLLSLRRLILYIYTKGLQETPPTQKAYSVYLYQRFTGDSSHSEGLFYIFILKAYRRLLPLRRLILYI